MISIAFALTTDVSLRTTLHSDSFVFVAATNRRR
jgi:hypothetical protein